MNATSKRSPICVWLDTTSEGRDYAKWIVSRDHASGGGAPDTISIHDTHEEAREAAEEIDPDFVDLGEGDR